VSKWIRYAGLLWWLPVGSLWATEPPGRLSSGADYHKYVDPLVTVADFGIQYSDDGAADASVLFPRTDTNPYDRPRDPVIALVRLRKRSVPLLIDCLSDGRVSTAQFNGTSITKPMKLPVGYVCLDMLMAVTPDRPVSDPDCWADGLGACMNEGFYFRPDDYSSCWKETCYPRPWVIVVQKKWRHAFLAKRLRFRNPYDGMRIPEYEEFATPRK